MASDKHNGKVPGQPALARAAGIPNGSPDYQYLKQGFDLRLYISIGWY